MSGETVTVPAVGGVESVTMYGAILIPVMDTRAEVSVEETVSVVVVVGIDLDATRPLPEVPVAI
jgi:hypothetical protein